MKKISIYLIAVLSLSAMSSCKKDSSKTGAKKLNGCFINSYVYRSGANIDSVPGTYITDDSLSYSISNPPSTDIYIYCYKFKGDSVSYRRYTNNISHLSYYGTYFLNSQGYSTSSIFYTETGNNGGSNTSTYDANGRPLHETSDYSTYDYTTDYHYNNSGNKIYSITVASGIINYRDSVVYEYDLSKLSNIAYGYPHSFLFGAPDMNLVTKIKTYNALTAALKSTTMYTYTFGSDGYVSQKITAITDAVSSTVIIRTEKFTIQCR